MLLRFPKIDNRRNFMRTSKECVTLFSRYPDKILRRFRTVNDICIGVLQYGRDQARDDWLVIFEQIGTVNGPDGSHRLPSRARNNHHANLLNRFKDNLKKKRPHLTKKEVLFNQDNARVQTCVFAMAKLIDLGCNLLIRLFPNL